MIQAVTKSLHNLFFAIADIFPTNGDRIIQSVFNLKDTNLNMRIRYLPFQAMCGACFSV